MWECKCTIKRLGKQNGSAIVFLEDVEGLRYDDIHCIRYFPFRSVQLHF